MAAPQAISNERLGVLFETDTMKPRITDPAFVDALTKRPLLLKEGAGEASPSAASIIPILGKNDRLLAVTSSSRNAASAFKLLEWLALPETSSQFARIGGSWLPPRRSLASSASWFDSSLSSNDRADRSKNLEAALNGERSLVIPRIPGIDDYLAALDAAVKSVIENKTPPAAALQACADHWEQITDRLGRDKQRAAYLKHLGISDK
jgi:ABC-type glycerol-3-phosphate transport system substrate-binding protein